MLKQETKLLWHEWIKVTRDRCHLHFELEKNDLSFHIETCLKGSERTAQRISEDIKKEPKFILDIGSSVGFNCFSIAKSIKNINFLVLNQMKMLVKLQMQQLEI